MTNARPLDFSAIHGVFILYICRFWDHAPLCLIEHIPPALYRRNGQDHYTVLWASPVLIFFTSCISHANRGWAPGVCVHFGSTTISCAVRSLRSSCGTGRFRSACLFLKRFVCCLNNFFCYISNALCECDRMTFCFAAAYNTGELPFWFIPLLRTQCGLCSIMWTIAV